MKTTPKNGFIVSAALVRVVAIAFVVSLHTTDALIDPTNYLGGISWWFANTVNSLARTGVPLFIMLSGNLLLSKEENFVRSFMVKRTIIRIGIPLLFWGIFYFWWRHKWWGEEISLANIITKVLSTNLFHLYFLFIIAGLYLITPYLRDLYKLKSNANKKKIIIYSFLFSIIATIALYKIPFLAYFSNISTIFILYIGYYLAGDFLRNINLGKIKAFFAITIVSILLISTSILGYLSRIMLLSGNGLFFNSTSGLYFTDYLSPNVIAMSLIIFVLIINTENSKIIKNKIITKIITFFSLTAFGVYLIHPFIIDILDHFANMAIHLIQSDLWLYIIKKIILVYFISHLLVYTYRSAIQKFKKIRLKEDILVTIKRFL